jgi:hypothetical protein
MGANDKVEATFHNGAAGERLRMPQTVDEIAEAVSGRYATLHVEGAGVKMPVIVTAVSARRDPIDITPPDAPPGTWREYEVGGLVDIDIKLSGAPKVSGVLADRRQRAREAAADTTEAEARFAFDDAGEVTVYAHAIEAAIETATRVRVTPEALRAALRESDAGRMTRESLEAALTELGFEVEA